MAREILFKAKRIDNGEWVEGLLWKKKYQSNKWFISCFPDKDDNEDVYVVDADTICQYTGLTDKNGNKIWENDVCTCKKRGCAFFGCVVKWNRVKARFDVNAMGCNFSMTLEECLDGVSINGLDYEVIGNIFDNPELLGGADNG